ncbi:MAG: hypothetical protein WCS30_13910, partial [Selenomonadaceae bacterium]
TPPMPTKLRKFQLWDFPAGRQHRIPAQVFLPADESTAGHAAVRQRYVLLFYEFLPYKLAQVHYIVGFQYHPALY